MHAHICRAGRAYARACWGTQLRARTTKSISKLGLVRTFTRGRDGTGEGCMAEVFQSVEDSRLPPAGTPVKSRGTGPPITPPYLFKSTSVVILPRILQTFNKETCRPEQVQPDDDRGRKLFV